MRLFIAVCLSDEMKHALHDTQRELYNQGVRGRFTAEENLHLTLAFIGDRAEPGSVMNALSSVPFAPFELTLEGMGSFDDICWAGMEKSVPLAAVTRRIRRALAEKGIPFDTKPFIPHITLIRGASGKLPDIRPSQANMTVRRISLMRSEHGKSGMIYTELAALEAEGT